MKTQKVFIAIVVFVLITSLTSCYSKDDLADELLKKIDVISLKDHLILSNLTALNWQPDAYLTEVYITFSENRNNYIEFDYESENNKLEAYSVRVFDDGNLDESPFLKYDINVNNKIGENEWKIDTSEALIIAFSDKRTKQFIIDQTENVCGFLVLEKTNLSEHALIWRINIDNCKDITKSIQIKIDANTCEIVN
jgi:hypothetical protein